MTGVGGTGVGGTGVSPVLDLSSSIAFTSTDERARRPFHHGSISALQDEARADACVSDLYPIVTMASRSGAAILTKMSCRLGLATWNSSTVPCDAADCRTRWVSVPPERRSSW